MVVAGFCRGRSPPVLLWLVRQFFGGPSDPTFTRKCFVKTATMLRAGLIEEEAPIALEPEPLNPKDPGWGGHFEPRIHTTNAVVWILGPK